MNISVFLAFWAGFITFLSPCVLPLIPSYVSYITGITLSDLEAAQDSNMIRRQTMINSLLFICGFSLVFIAMGAAAGALGSLLFRYREILRLVGGWLIIIFALQIMGVFRIPLLNKYFKFEMKNRPIGYLGTFIIGMVFAAGWTPCVGPILGTILVLAGGSATALQGILLLFFFSLGLAVPFFLSSLAINSFLAAFKRLTKYFWLINAISGLLLLAVGILLLTNYFETITQYIMMIIK